MTAALTYAPGRALNLAQDVPAAITEVAVWAPNDRAGRADRYADVIASGADILWAAPGTRAEITPGEVQEAIVYGLAILAHRDGGVTFAGLHWHTGGCPTCPGPGAWSLPPDCLERADRGAFFTPRALAEEVTWNTLGPRIGDAQVYEEIGQPRIVDIACGSGAFLVAAARLLAREIERVFADDDRGQAWFVDELDAADMHAAALAYAADSVYGVDLDPLSVELSRLALQLLAPGERINPTRIRVGNALIGATHPDWEGADPKDLGGPRLSVTYPDVPGRFDWPTEFPEVFGLDNPWRRPGDSDVADGFDVIVGNPPYLGGQKLTGTYGAPYRDHLIRHVAYGRRGSADLAVYFWLRAAQLVNQYGTVGLVMPTNIDRGGNARVWQPHFEQCAYRVYRAEPPRRWPSRSAAVTVRILYAARLLHVGPEFTGVDDDYGRGQVHTCGFGSAPPRHGERWPAQDGCPRCTALAEAGRAVIRVETEGQAYEVTRPVK
jgi:hypothetical protein